MNGIAGVSRNPSPSLFVPVPELSARVRKKKKMKQ